MHDQRSLHQSPWCLCFQTSSSMGYEETTSDAAKYDVLPVPNPYVVYRGSLEALIHKYGTVAVPSLQYLYKKVYDRLLDHTAIGFTTIDEFLTGCRDPFYTNKPDNIVLNSIRFNFLLFYKAIDFLAKQITAILPYGVSISVRDLCHMRRKLRKYRLKNRRKFSNIGTSVPRCITNERTYDICST